jgi:hypothetical protein
VTKTIDFGGEVAIDAAAEKVYALLDWADHRNAKRALGDQVTQVETEADRFSLVMREVPRHVFELTVTHAVPFTSYGFDCVIVPPIGRLLKTHELYGIEPMGTESCRLKLLNSSTFVEGLGPDELGEEMLMMSIASHNALAKLKIHAEQGADAVKAVGDRVIVQPHEGAQASS